MGDAAMDDDGFLAARDADEGFGDEPSSVGKDWAPALEGMDPDLRAALEAKLAEFAREG